MKILRRLKQLLCRLRSTPPPAELCTGNEPQDFYKRPGELSQTCSALSALMSDKETGTLIEGFRDVPGGANQLESVPGQNTDNAWSLLENLSRLNDLTEGLQKIILRLRDLGVSMKIESPLPGNRDLNFDSLADEVEKLLNTYNTMLNTNPE